MLQRGHGIERERHRYGRDFLNGEALSQEKINQIGIAYLNYLAMYLRKPNIQHIARMCRVSRNTVYKYRRLGRWDEIIKCAQEKARERAGYI